jgi:hypothetical protein
MFGGEFIDEQNNVHLYGDTWVYQQAFGWTERHPAHTPAPREWPMMAFDPARHETVLFGGGDANTVFSDTWTWDGVDWTQQQPADRPPPMCCHGMAYDALTQRIVLFGGGSTWTWDGTNWTNEDPPGIPKDRYFPGMAGSVRHVVLFGGDVCLELCLYPRDTWNWNGTTWIRRRVSTAPPARADMAMAESTSTHLTVLFGGGNENTPPYLFGDTWVWDGNGWAERTPATHPSPREGARLVYVLSTGLFVLFGGVDASSYRTDTWVWTGADWTCVDGCS